MSESSQRPPSGPARPESADPPRRRTDTWPLADTIKRLLVADWIKSPSRHDQPQQFELPAVADAGQSGADAPVVARTAPAGDTAIFRFDPKVLSALKPQDEQYILGGKYHLHEMLAEGSMGTVCRAEHLALRKDFAVKIIQPERSADHEARRLFLREARVLSQLNHPNIVQVTDFGLDERYGAYMVMEFLQGEELADRLAREHRLAPELSMRICLQVAEALSCMHKQDLVHCDIKPENIFLCDAPGEPGGLRAKLVDFGLSRFRADATTLNEREVGGTPTYAAPEQFTGIAPQPGMDVYSLGVLLYELLDGTPPFTGPADEVYYKKCRTPVRAMRAVDASVMSVELERVIFRALVPEPERRVATIEAFIAELRPLLEGLGQSAPDAGSSGGERRGDRQVQTMAAANAYCADCPLPAFLVDGAAHILAANSAFWQLIGAEPEDTLGHPLSATNLGNISDRLDHEVAQAQALHSPRQRKVDFISVDGLPRSYLFCFVPLAPTDGLGRAVWGIVVPL